MKFPRLKNALLCRILVYVVVLGGFILPGVIVASLHFVPLALKILAGLALAIGFLFYLFKNFALLMGMDIALTAIHCQNTARKRFPLPDSFSAQKVEKRISRFGKRYDPIERAPSPHLLQYRSQASFSGYSSGTEKVIATYSVDLLDEEQYQFILRSATGNSKALKGKKRCRLLAPSQKALSLNCVTVIVIFAKRVDEAFGDGLFETVCQNGGDGYDTAIIPCVVDLKTRFVTFDSVRIPYVGFQYPVKNRGIRLIRKYLFHNKLPLAKSPDRLDPIHDTDPEQSLWSFWRMVKKEMVSDDREVRKQYQKMAHRDIFFEDGFLYLKWEERGILLPVEMNEELKEAKIEEIEFWDYPKSNKVAKETAKEMKSLIIAYFSELGYTAKF